MICAQCKREIPRTESSARVDAGTRLSDGTRVPMQVDLHTRSCEGKWWLSHFPWLVTARNRIAASER